MRLRRFNKNGIALFREYLVKLSNDPKLSPPEELLTDEAGTDLISGDIDENKKFDRRFDAGEFFSTLIDCAGIKLPDKDTGLWAWLALLFFDQVCPKDGHGNRKPRDMSRLIPQLDNYQRFYRHLFLGPFLIYKAHKDDPQRALALLCGKLEKPGEIVETFASRKELVTNRGVVGLITYLYYDNGTKKFKPRAAAKDKGAARRLAAWLNQIDRTYYLYGMKMEELKGLLPSEFKKFQSA